MHRAVVNLGIRKPTRPRRTYHLAKYINVFAILVIVVLCLVVFCTRSNTLNIVSPEGEIPVFPNVRNTPQCRDVQQANNQCAFIKQYCQDEDDGLISYLQLYYCTLGALNVVTCIMLVPWIALLFTAIGICAGDFFAVNLSSIARSLHASDTLAGVTLLALGNGGPDIFSTWAAVTSNTPELAIGELVGAASFITTVVAGSLTLVNPFRVRAVSLVRDALFLLLTACLLLACLVTQEFHLWQGVLMIGLYVVYVTFVMVYHWWTSRGLEVAEDGEHGDEEDSATPTESQPLLHGSHSRTHTQRNHSAGQMSPAVYHEIGEWRLAHGRCITSPSGYNVQPSLPGSCEYSWRQRQHHKPAIAGTTEAEERSALPKSRSYEGDLQVLKTLFPSLNSLSHRSLWHIIVNLVTAVPYFLFKLTVPVVDNEHDTDCHHRWDRWLLVLQAFVAPQFVWVMFWLSSDLPSNLTSWMVPAAYCLLGSVVFASLVFIFSTPQRPPRWYPFLSLIGFVMGAFWLSTIADEVVAIMKALGAISGLSQAILGYTLFAIGNSLDDWVADITVSQHGHPVMALAACFGGPLLNILLGLGTSITYVTIRDAKRTGRLVPIFFKADFVLVVPTAVVAATMVFVVLVLRWNQWEMKKSLGIALIGVWCLLAVVNVVLEFAL